MNAQNPLLAAWTAPFALPPFMQIGTDHYRPAFEAALHEHDEEIDAIVQNPAVPDYANTIDALELAGQALNKIGGVFWNLSLNRFRPKNCARLNVKYRRDWRGIMRPSHSTRRFSPASHLFTSAATNWP